LHQFSNLKGSYATVAPKEEVGLATCHYCRRVWLYRVTVQLL